VEVVRFVRCEDFLGGGHFHPALWAGFMWKKDNDYWEDSYRNEYRSTH